MTAGDFQLAEGTTNGAPASGYGRLEVRADGTLYFLNDSGGNYAVSPLAANTVTKVQTVTRDTQQSTTSTSYVDITSMTLTTVAAADVLVFYTDTMQHSAAGANLYLQIVVDGSAAQQAVFVSSGAGYGTIIGIHSPALSLASGKVIKMQMKCDSGTIYSNTQNSAAGRARLTIVELYK